MIVTTRRIRLAAVMGAVLAIGLASSALAAPAAASGRTLGPGTNFYVRHPDDAALAQIGDLRGKGDTTDANLLSQMLNTPQAVWFTSGTPADVYGAVKNTVKNATAKGTVPVLVAYDLPFRDCGQYSSGGALNTAAYLAWIDGFAKGIGSAKAVVLLEPDGLGIIPYNIDINGNMEWCQPDLTGTGLASGAEANAARFEQLSKAVDRLEQQPNVSVYLDGTHSGWLGVGDISQRLVKANVAKAQGFFLNVSNFQTTERQQKFGTWISKCVAFGSNPASWGNGHYNWCASQYYPANAGDFSTWTASDQWYVNNVESQTWWYPADGNLPTHFVIDTSRNGVGPWTPPAHPAGDAQDWCNPPDRGLGLRPAAQPDAAFRMLDAYLWVKTPGQSDGQCARWAPSGGIDPVRGYADPAAGAWFPQMALELVQHAAPALPSGKPQPAW